MRKCRLVERRECGLIVVDQNAVLFDAAARKAMRTVSTLVDKEGSKILGDTHSLASVRNIAMRVPFVEVLFRMKLNAEKGISAFRGHVKGFGFKNCFPIF